MYVYQILFFSLDVKNIITLFKLLPKIFLAKLSLFFLFVCFFVCFPFNIKFS